MMSAYSTAERHLVAKPRKWLVTGAAGFIGSHLVQRLLQLGQKVVGLDNFSTGRRWVVDAIASSATGGSFRFVEGDIRDGAVCSDVMHEVELVLHQAALGSVPRSIKDPYTSHESNVDGFLRVMLAARDAGVERVVYASSSSVYGDHPGLPKVERSIGRQLSPYAATKRINEVYADVLGRSYGLSIAGLRYFNVFGPRQDPNGPYAAVIPRWIESMLKGSACTILGDGATTRDFCFIENVIQANILAATCERAALESGGVFNIACGDQATLLQLHQWLAEDVAAKGFKVPEPQFGAPREGDVRHSLADITEASQRLGYSPAVRVREGIRATVEWFAARHS